MLRHFILAFFILPAVTLSASPARSGSTNLWPNWEKYRTTVQAPSGAIKAADMARARENLRRYTWAQEYLQSLKQEADPWLPKIDTAFLERMIPETTPGATGFTPCPACRDLGKPFLPHGDWSWDPQNPDVLKCKVCNTVYPNEKYPESVVLKTTWGKPQTLTFSGAAPFKLFDYNGVVRPSMTGNIRAQKTGWMSRLTGTLAQAYALSGEEKYATAVHAILLRFATTYPHWLFHMGYGEYADMDPGEAARNIEKLPQDELLVPPNKPDRTFHKTFWVAGRAAGSGGESLFVIPLATAYDITRTAQVAGKPLYSESDQIAIEKNLLLDSTQHMVADKKINNKSVGNRSAAAMVGMVVGDPELVRFGIEGFDLTVNGWFLPDGGTPESPAYALMTLGRISEFAQALRGYSDPPGYHDAQGKRYDKFNPYRDTNYGKVWEAMFKTLRGDLRYPSFADSYTTSMLSAQHAEILTSNYPERTEYAALLKELLQGDWSKPTGASAIYLAEPGREKRQLPPLTLPDNVLPDLRIGFMRTGADGLESLLNLSASHWGSHHHHDSLNLSYWKQGEELLSDLGYLWDHPDAKMTKRAFAHNTVLLDGEDQVTTSRGGDVKYFITTPHVKAMRAASQAYKQASVYERAATLIDHGNGQNYAVDVFWVQGGKTQDYVFHGPNNNYKLEGATASEAKVYDLKNVRQMPAKAPWQLNWQVDKALQFTAWSLPQEGETTYLGDGWGQRDSRNKDRGATLPYIVRRTAKNTTGTFVSLFEGHAPGKATVQKVQRLAVPDKTDVVALQVDTPNAHDYIVVSPTPQTLEIKTPDGLLKSTGTLAVVSVQNGHSTFTAGDGLASLG